MDYKTRMELEKIGRSLPKKLVLSGIKTEKPFANYAKDLMKEVDNDRHISNSEKEKIKHAIRNNEMIKETVEKETTKIDEKVNEKIKGIVDYKVKQAIKSGKIKKAEKDGFFDFVKDHSNA